MNFCFWSWWSNRNQTYPNKQKTYNIYGAMVYNQTLANKVQWCLRSEKLMRWAFQVSQLTALRFPDHGAGRGNPDKAYGLPELRRQSRIHGGKVSRVFRTEHWRREKYKQRELCRSSGGPLKVFTWVVVGHIWGQITQGWEKNHRRRVEVMTPGILKGQK